MTPPRPSATSAEASPQTAPTYDESEWPLFLVRMPKSAMTAGAFRLHLEALREPYRRGVPYGELIIMGEYPPLPPIQRQMAAEAMKANYERYPGILRAKAIVVRSTVERGVVTAVGWVARPPYPFAPFEHLAEAKAWLLSELARDPAPHSTG